MVFDDDAPYASLTCHLSKKGILDGVRQGVKASETVIHYLERGTDAWERFFELSPDPVYYGEGDPHDSVVGARLVIGRQMSAVIAPRAPEALDVDWLDDDFDSPPRVWRRPRMVVEFGSPDEVERFDSYLWPDDLLAHEQAAQERVKATFPALEAELAGILDEWRTWVRSEGIATATHLTECLAEFQRDQLLTHSQVETAKAAIQPLADLCEAIESGDDSDEELTALMGLLPPAHEAVQQASGHASNARSRKKELEEAAEWVRASGSTRLRKALDTGLLDKALGVYRDERLRSERPGWDWLRKDEQLKDVVNPSEVDLDALLEARKIDRFAKLWFRTGDRTVIVTGLFMNRRVMISTRALVEDPSSGGYGYDEEPF